MNAATQELEGPSLSWLAFVPRDTLFIRDGRSFDAATNTTARTVRPWPSTIAGAVRAAFGADQETVCGPVLARRAGAIWEPWFPAPADLHYERDVDTPYAFRLTTASLPGKTAP
jgi:hypothetical protein